MLACQLSHTQSLCEISGGLAACEGKLRYLFLDGASHGSASAYVNQDRPWQLSESVFGHPFGRRQKPAKAQRRKFRFKQKPLAVDLTSIDRVVPVATSPGRLLAGLCRASWRSWLRSDARHLLPLLVEHLWDLLSDNEVSGRAEASRR